MGIDIRTIILITGIIHMVQVLVFLHQYITNKSLKGPGWWLIWSATEFLGFFVLLLRSIPSFTPIAIIFQNPIILSGTIFVYIGVLRFFDKKINWKFIISFFICFIILHIFFILVHNKIQTRTLILDIFLSLIAFITAISLYKNKTPAIASIVNFNIAIFVIHGGIFSYRTVMIMLGTSINDVFSQSAFNFIQYFDALLMGLLWTLGFILMLNQRLNAEVSEAKTHFEKVFNTSPDAAVISRLSDGLFIDCNESYEKISGYNKDEILNQSSLGINLWKDPADRKEVVRMIVENGFCDNYEALFQRKDGEIITGLISAKIFMLKGVPHMISVTRDINDRKKAEKEIELKNEELLKLNAEKNKFFSIIAHDLRSPLGAFIGLTELLADEKLTYTSKQKKNMSLKMNHLASNLFNLLENLLEWSQIQNGHLRFTPEKLDLNMTVTESLRTLTESAENKAIEITVDVPDKVEVFADTYMLQTIIRNLVSNAIKFVEKGGKITISVDSAEENRTVIKVKDTGIGMTKQILENLFSIHSKSSRQGTSGEAGTGLGLLLCKEFVEKHNGKIWVESEVGKGSVFYFTVQSKAVV
jgi:PAS domain S-box-containing protein